MRRPSGPKSLAALLVLYLTVLPGTAQAYLDPGTGSFILQMLIGAVLGGLVAVGVFWRKVLAFLKGTFSRRQQ